MADIKVGCRVRHKKRGFIGKIISFTNNGADVMIEKSVEDRYPVGYIYSADKDYLELINSRIMSLKEKLMR